MHPEPARSPEVAVSNRAVGPPIGIKAATTSAGDAAFYLVIKRAAGVVRRITYKVPREKMLELARALSQP